MRRTRQNQARAFDSPDTLETADGSPDESARDGLSRYGCSLRFAELVEHTTSLPRSICCTRLIAPPLAENSRGYALRSPSRTRWIMRCFALLDIGAA